MYFRFRLGPQAPRPPCLGYAGPGESLDVPISLRKNKLI